MYKVSVIVPTYNRSHLILRTLESVFQQTYKSIQIVVIDDGSTDNTSEVLEQYKSFENFEYYYQNNQGRSSARNAGIAKSSGEFLMFLDSDDYLEKDAIERLINLRNEHPQINIFAGGYRLFETKQNRELTIYTRGKDLFIKDIFLEEVKEMVLNIGNHILHANLVNGVKFNENLDFAEDWEFLLNVIRGEQAVIVKEVVSNVYRHEDNSAFDEIQNSIIDVVKRYIHQLENEKQSKQNKIYIDNFNLRLLMAYNRSSKKSTAFKYLVKLVNSSAINKKVLLRELIFLCIPTNLLICFRNVQLKLKTSLNFITQK